MKKKYLIFISILLLIFFSMLGIAEENVESTKKTYDGTQEVVGTFQQVYVSAEQLREISDKLVKGIGYFHI